MEHPCCSLNEIAFLLPSHSSIVECVLIFLSLGPTTNVSVPFASTKCLLSVQLAGALSPSSYHCIPSLGESKGRRLAGVDLGAGRETGIGHFPGQSFT